MRKKRLFYDLFICKHFESTFETVMKAEACLNASLDVGRPVSVLWFYNFLGVDDLDFDSVFEKAEVDTWSGFDHTVSEVDGLECVILSPPFKIRDGRVLVFSKARNHNYILEGR